jgi:TonB-linked SusC/RagA family outer membrane protein
MKKSDLFVKCFLFVFFSVFACGALWAQAKTVSGIVTDAAGEPVIGASVLVKGTSVGVITNMNGEYSVSVSEVPATLVFSYLGTITQERSVNATTGKVNVVLKENIQQLDELVVVGYGTQKKSDLTGAVSSVGGEQVGEIGKTSVLGAIQGEIPGVLIKSSSSRSGSDFNVLIRGQNSITGETKPLYVVDGVFCDDIGFLNPQDIEKIDILKDASSTAIYGSRGSCGVIIIQTKSGASVQGKKTSVSYDGYYGAVHTARMPKFMDTREWMQYRALCYQYTADANGDGVLEFNTGDLKSVWFGKAELNPMAGKELQQPVDKEGNWSGSQWLLDRYLKNESTDWNDYVTQTGLQQNHYVGITGATKEVSYVVGIGYQEEKGVFVNDMYKRYNFKLGLDGKINKWWSAGGNFNMAFSDQELGSDNAIVNSFRMAPQTVPYDENGDLIDQPGKTNDPKPAYPYYPTTIGGGGFTSSVNPLVDLEETTNNTRRFTGLGNLYLQYSPIQDLAVKTTFSPSFNYSRNGFYKGSKAEGNFGSAAIANATNSYNLSYTWDNTVHYKFNINSDHVFNLMGLFSVYNYEAEYYKILTGGYDARYDFYNLAAGSTTYKPESWFQKATMVSYAARLNYAFKDRYLLTATIREDGSSKLAKKWASFPSAAVAWRVSQEDFMSETSSWLQNLKLRLSLGYTGNNRIDPYVTQQLTGSQSYYNFGSAAAYGTPAGSIVNTALTWEKTRELDLGVDFGLLHGRISGSFDLYDRLSDGLLQERTLLLESGSGSMIDNVGKISNKGFEIALNGIFVQKSDFTISANATFAANTNKIVELLGHSEDGFSQITPDNKWIIGQPISAIYGYVFDGVWTADGIKAAISSKDPRAVNAKGEVIAREGQAKLKDFDSNGIDPEDRRVQGHAAPSWTGGVGINASYRGFDFSASIFTEQGVYMYSPFIAEFTNYNDRGRQKLSMEYYIPAGTTLIDNDGYYYKLEQAVNYQGSPMAYTNNAVNANCGPYWQQGRLEAKEMPGAWVDASYWKVRNITLGYTMPKNIINNWNVEKLRLYVNVLNPFVFTNYLGFDPEWAGASMDRDNGPSTVTYQVGINLTF